MSNLALLKDYVPIYGERAVVKLINESGCIGTHSLAKWIEYGYSNFRVAYTSQGIKDETIEIVGVEETYE